jgi:GH43 family beta-xylosidase
MDDENVNYQKAKLMFKFRDYDDYGEMRAVIWTKPLRWINPITAVLMAAAYCGTIVYKTYDHYNWLHDQKQEVPLGDYFITGVVYGIPMLTVLINET